MNNVSRNQQQMHATKTCSVLARATRRNIQEDDILHSHRRENLKSTLDRNDNLTIGWCTNLCCYLLNCTVSHLRKPNIHYRINLETCKDVENRLLRRDAVFVLLDPTFRRNASPSSRWRKSAIWEHSNN
jgi:hypothetical protein